MGGDVRSKGGVSITATTYSLSLCRSPRTYLRGHVRNFLWTPRRTFVPKVIEYPVRDVGWARIDG